MDRERLKKIAEDQLDQTLETTTLDITGHAERAERIEGKVRDCYVTGDGRRLIVVTDRLSAFDRVITTIPFKGQVLNQLAAFWFEESGAIAANHVLAVPDPNVMVGHECKPLAAEFVMRAYLTGVTSTSIWRAYEGGAREFCGHAIPDGMKKNQKLPAAILTPSTKAEKGGHDVSVSREKLLEMTNIDPSVFNAAADMSARLFAFGQERAAERGMILVDTKYEIGRSAAGELMMIDEIHTPDSSRYWYRDSYNERIAAGQEPRSLDKEFVRRWLSEDAGYSGEGPIPEVPAEIRVEAALRYIETYELVTGRPFVPDTTDPNRRIATNVAAFLESNPAGPLESADGATT